MATRAEVVLAARADDATGSGRVIVRCLLRLNHRNLAVGAERISDATTPAARAPPRRCATIGS